MVKTTVGHSPPSSHTVLSILPTQVAFTHRPACTLTLILSTLQYHAWPIVCCTSCEECQGTCIYICFETEKDPIGCKFSHSVQSDSFQKFNSIQQARLWRNHLFFPRTVPWPPGPRSTGQSLCLHFSPTHTPPPCTVWIVNRQGEGGLSWLVLGREPDIGISLALGSRGHSAQKIGICLLIVVLVRCHCVAVEGRGKGKKENVAAQPLKTIENCWEMASLEANDQISRIARAQTLTTLRGKRGKSQQWPV